MSAHDDEFSSGRVDGGWGHPETAHWPTRSLASRLGQYALALDIDGGQIRYLQAIADDGMLGGTAEEVALYLITRGLDDMARSGAIVATEEKQS